MAVGELVGAATIDIEDIDRRSRKNRAKSMLKVLFEASSESGNSIDSTTLTVWPTVLPLFALGGIAADPLAEQDEYADRGNSSEFGAWLSPDDRDSRGPGRPC